MATTQQSLITKLDRVFSLFIRLRDSDSYGRCKCVTCGSVNGYKSMDCGHFIDRKHLSTRFDERNCHAQCIECNRFRCGNIKRYEKYLIDTYGDGIIEELNNKKHSVSKLSTSDMSDMIKKYNELVTDLINEKGL